MKIYRCDQCKRDITDYTPDPIIKIIIQDKRKSELSEFDLCIDCANIIHQIIAKRPFIDKKDK